MQPGSFWARWWSRLCWLGRCASMQPSYLLTVLTFLPLAGTVALFMLRADDHEWIRRIAFGISLFEFALSLLLVRGFASNSAGYQFVELHNWIPAPPIHYHLGVDGINLFLVLLTTFLTPIAMLASWKSIETREIGRALVCTTVT